MKVNLKYLKQFQELSRYNSMKRYAIESGYTHAQVSRMVAELEKTFGYKLMIRERSKGLQDLTTRGKKLLEQIPRIFDEIKTAQRLLETDEFTPQGRYEILTTSFFIDDWICPKLAEFKKKYPEITLNLIANERTVTHEMKKTMMIISPFTEPQPNIVQTPLVNLNVSLWGSQKYLKNFGTPKTVEDLSKHQFILYEENYPWPSADWLQSMYGVKSEKITFIRSVRGMLSAAKEGLGLLFISSAAINALAPNGFIKLLPEEVKFKPIELVFSYPDFWKNYKGVQVIENFFVETFKERALSNV